MKANTQRKSTKSLKAAKKLATQQTLSKGQYLTYTMSNTYISSY